jgi:hypothetical protein
MYSVVVFKATRGGRIHTIRPDVSGAVDSAVRWYETVLSFRDHGILSSGVAVIVIPDEYGQEIDGKGIVWLDRSKVIFQAGSI